MSGYPLAKNSKTHTYIYMINIYFLRHRKHESQSTTSYGGSAIRCESTTRDVGINEGWRDPYAYMRVLKMKAISINHGIAITPYRGGALLPATLQGWRLIACRLIGVAPYCLPPYRGGAVLPQSSSHTRKKGSSIRIAHPRNV